MNTPLNMDDRLLTAHEVQRIFGIGRTTLHRWRKERGFPAPERYSASCIRYSAARIREWRAQHQEKPAH